MGKISSWLSTLKNKPVFDINNKQKQEGSLQAIKPAFEQEVHNLRQKIDAKHEYQYIDMPDGTVAYHAWEVKPCHFYILHPVYGIAHYAYEENKWTIFRCDNEIYKKHIKTCISKNYPAERFHNLFTLEIGKANRQKKEQQKKIWNMMASTMERNQIDIATWNSFTQNTNQDNDFAITWIEKANFDNQPQSSLEQYYLRKFLPWFLKTQNDNYVHMLVGFDYNDDVKNYRHMLHIPKYFLNYPLSDWLTAADFYAKMSDEEYALLYGQNLPLTPELPNANMFEEVDLIM